VVSGNKAHRDCGGRAARLYLLKRNNLRKTKKIFKIWIKRRKNRHGYAALEVRCDPLSDVFMAYDLLDPGPRITVVTRWGDLIGVSDALSLWPRELRIGRSWANAWERHFTVFCLVVLVIIFEHKFLYANG